MAGNLELYQEAIDQGHSAAWEQDWKNAARHYRRALQEFPENPNALTSLGLALYQLQDYDEALRAYMLAAKLKPDDPLPLEKASELYELLGSYQRATDVGFQSAELYARQRDVEKALNGWQRVVRINPEHLPAHTRLALVYERLGKTSQAVMEYLAVTSLYQNAGDLPKAAQALQNAVRIKPESPQVLQALAMVKARRMLPKPTRSAGTELKPAVKSKPVSAAAEPSQTPTSLDPIAGSREKALAVLASMIFETSTEQIPEPSGPAGFQDILKGAGTRHYGRQADQSRINLYISQVIDYQSRGMDKDAASELEKAIGLGLDHPAAYFELGLLHFSCDRLESAVRSLKRALISEDFTLGSYLVLGQIFQRLNQPRDAAVAYLEALKLADALVVEPSQADGLRQLYDPLIEAQSRETDTKVHTRLIENISDLLLREGWQEKLLVARQQLPSDSAGAPLLPIAEILSESSTSGVVESITTIHDLAQRGRWRSAMEEAFWAIQHAPTYLPLHTYIGDLLVQQGYEREAIEKLSVVARAYSVRNEPQRAIDILNKLIELAPMNLPAREMLIEQLVTIRSYDQAIQQYLNLASVYYSRAELDHTRRTYAEALRLTQQQGVNPAWKVKILHQMADIDMQSLDWRQALKIFEQIRTLDPADKKARANLISLSFRLGQPAVAIQEIDHYLGYLLQQGKLEQALPLLEEMSAEYSNNLAVRQRLAEVYRQSGKTEQAIEHLDAVADALIDAGDRASAMKILRTIIKMNPPNVDRYQQVLNHLELG